MTSQRLFERREQGGEVTLLALSGFLLFPQRGSQSFAQRFILLSQLLALFLFDHTRRVVID